MESMIPANSKVSSIQLLRHPRILYQEFWPLFFPGYLFPSDIAGMMENCGK
jgi:hypothetical protein